MIVVDTNILVHLYLDSEFSPKAEAIFRRDPQWAAPLLWRSEFRNVLALYMRRKRLSLVEAQQIMSTATELMLAGEYEISSFHVLDLVKESTCSAYDCEFVALAQDLEVPLVTTDQQILDQFHDVAVSLDAFLASPKD